MENVNLYRHLVDRFLEDPVEANRMGALERGADPKADTNTTEQIDLLVAPVKIVLPLWKLAPIFNTPGRLMPSFLASGLRISITLASGAFATQSDVLGTGTTFELLRPSLMLDTYDLIDSVANKLARVSAENGLEFYFEGIEHTQHSSSETSNTVELKKSVSRALNIITSHRLTADISSGTDDSLRTSPFDFEQVQYRVGSTYLTQQPIESVQEAYYLALSMFGLNSGLNTKSARLYDFDATDANGIGCGVICGDLGRSHVMDLSSQPLNSSRTVSLNYKRTTSASHRYDMFLKHIVLVKIYLNNCLVKS
jgi:hypothetical protein